MVDAKALFDVLHRDELQTSAGADKRTHLEALVIKDKLVESKAHARWASSERQYADGLTSVSAQVVCFQVVTVEGGPSHGRRARSP